MWRALSTSEICFRQELRLQYRLKHSKRHTDCRLALYSVNATNSSDIYITANRIRTCEKPLGLIDKIICRYNKLGGATHFSSHTTTCDLGWTVHCFVRVDQIILVRFVIRPQLVSL